ncbi:hypothetical protein J8273_1547 [Carpediemonas membranifera]|uniref:Uncharacterized protein n=1 Tax=Carpediemonas membranifera TaxID=201153 RepID=A0A8J6BB23_9EUKA|nr:hypothetical protein J8273_1547 [Carpediemonas membranifera]|eukprot:KAG9396542.1 hypothetical protein J8273_1547 [Carpediemonas membranifera]
MIEQSKPPHIDAFRAAYALSVRITQDMAGDVPSILARLFQLEFGDSAELNDDRINQGVIGDDLAAVLSDLEPSNAAARILLCRARQYLHAGPELSMNIELSDGVVLPDRLHTVLQGTLWAILMGAGADPDLYDEEDEGDLGRKEHKVYDLVAPETHKSLWFLCKKTFFTYNVATKENHLTKDGDGSLPISLFRRYGGRLFSRGYNDNQILGYPSQEYSPQYTLVRVPPVHDFFVDESVAVAVTPMGLYGWGCDGEGVLGLGWDGPAFPTRLVFNASSAVASFEAELRSWHKDRLVTQLVLTHSLALLSTRAGLVASGQFSECLVNPGLETTEFNPVPLPDGFRAGHVEVVGEMVLVTDECTGAVLASGTNECGQLGLGRVDDLTRLVPLPYSFDRVLFNSYTHTVLSAGRALLFIGDPRPQFRHFLPDNGDAMLTAPVPLVLPHAASAAFLSFSIALFVRADGRGAFGADNEGHSISFPFIPTVVRVSYRHGKATVFLSTATSWYGFGWNELGQVSSVSQAPFIHIPIEVDPATVTGLELVRAVAVEVDGSE